MKRWLVAHHMTLMANCRYSALDRAWVGNWSFLWLHAVISTENALVRSFVAWVCRCNKIAAAVAVTLHDVMIWAMPALYVAEYPHVGSWILNRPAAQRVHFRQFGLHDYVALACFFLEWCGRRSGRVRRSLLVADPFLQL